MSVGPGHGHHRTQRHRQQVVGRADAPSQQFGAAMLGHRCDAGRALHAVQATVAGQVERNDVGVWNHAAEGDREIAPVTALARQPAQEYPGAHGPHPSSPAPRARVTLVRRYAAPVQTAPPLRRLCGRCSCASPPVPESQGRFSVPFPFRADR